MRVSKLLLDSVKQIQPKYIENIGSKKLKGKFKLVPGKIRYPFHIAYGGIEEGIYAKDTVSKKFKTPLPKTDNNT